MPFDGASVCIDPAYQLMAEFSGQKHLRELGVYTSAEDAKAAMNGMVKDRPKGLMALGVRTVRLLKWGRPDRPHKFRVEPITPPRRKIIFKKIPRDLDL